MKAPNQHGLLEMLRLAPVVPVIVVHEVRDAVPLARALVQGGLPLLEVTLRTPAALEAVSLIRAHVEGAVCGVGTVLTPQQLDAAARAGAQFAVSPGATAALLDAASDQPMPLLPGASTASEVMALRERGVLLQKFFPAEPAGGAPFVSALASPLPDVRFCPTGGIQPEVAPAYLALPNVVCVGGSWMLPKTAISLKDWDAITRLAALAAVLRG